MSFFDGNLKPADDVMAEITTTLSTVRKHLEMDWSYLSEIRDDGVVFHALSQAEGKEVVQPGHVLPLEYTYCNYVAAGALPELITDTKDHPLTETIPATHDLPIRAHISVPIRRTDGSLFGMFCCLSSQPNPTLNDRDLDVVRLFSQLASKSLNVHLDEQAALKELRGQISNVIDHHQLAIHVQPIVSLRNGAVRAVEALSRIDAGTPRQKPEGVQWWFEQARVAQMQVPLELDAISRAIGFLPQLPPKVYLSVNVSPATLSSGRFREVLRKVPRDCLIVELTEHVEIAETCALIEQLDWLRGQRIGIAVDDVGAGYAGLATILKLRPNVIKLDRELVRQIDTDPAKQSLVQALLSFSNQENAFMIAEGIERVEEHQTLARLGVRLGQGYLYGRPGPARDQLHMIQTEKSVALPEG